jgi:peptidoglycan/LPS O-acetylase OafA/YrhL
MGGAVDVFFALSGYVMAMLARRSSETLPALSIRRYIRLALPAEASCV